MITGELRSRIDRLWQEFWTGGIANPLTVIEQITFLMFARLLDMSEARNEKRASRTGKKFKSNFVDDERFKELISDKYQPHQLRWSSFSKLSADEMLPLVRDGVFPHFKTISMEGAAFSEYMRDAQLMIQKPGLLVKAVEMIEELPLDDADTKGDLYEYLLSKLTTAGINGQFRTPRHIIRFMVELMAPQKDETIADPACGTGGFLVGAAQYMLETNSSKAGITTDPETGAKTYLGDQLDWDHFKSKMFHGFDFDATMLRIAAMNMLLHGIDAPDIHYQDALATSFPDKFPKAASNSFDIILANPPFKGSLDYEDVHKSLLSTVKTKKTELLFIALILRMLKLGGRCAMIVPDGVVNRMQTAYQNLRKCLIEDNQLEGVVSLPSGVFKPYAGVSTAILIFTKGGQSDHIWFYEVENDGFSLDDKRDPVDDNDLPAALASWRKRTAKKQTDRKQKGFFVPASEIAKNRYDLSVNSYKEVIYEEEAYDPPEQIIADMKVREQEIIEDLADLETMLATPASEAAE